MQTENLIPASEFCVHHNIEFSFISSLQECGLITVEYTQDSVFIPAEQLPELEKYVHLYYELEINLQGIEAITHLLKRIRNMQEEMLALKNKLSLYEENEF